MFTQVETDMLQWTQFNMRIEALQLSTRMEDKLSVIVIQVDIISREPVTSDSMTYDYVWDFICV